MVYLVYRYIVLKSIKGSGIIKNNSKGIILTGAITIEELIKKLYDEISNLESENYKVEITRNNNNTHIKIVKDYNNGLDSTKKEILNKYMGSASSDKINLNTVRDEYKKEL